jgi:hypothetical protein
VGTSSAFFAEVLQNLFQGWRLNPAELAALTARYAGTIQHWIKTKLPIETRGPAVDLLRVSTGPMIGQPLLQAALSDLQKIIPSYQYWPVLEPKVSAQPMPSQFADGGNLENTGIAALLAYSDIDSVIAFINPMTVMQPGAYGVTDGSGGFIPGTKVIVDASIPPLFGYQPYEAGGVGDGKGYLPYSRNASDRYPIYSYNQVFPQAAFPALLQGLWAASGGGNYAHPAIFTQRLAVQPNAWFGVTFSREVVVVWCYLSFVAEWEALFSNNQPVRALIELERVNNDFPNYSTLSTNLSATQINLLANLTAWAVNEAERTNSTLSSLFTAA